MAPAPALSAKEIELLCDIFKYGKLEATNVDWPAIDKKNGSQNKVPGKTASDAWYNLKRKHGLGVATTGVSIGGGKVKKERAPATPSPRSKKMKSNVRAEVNGEEDEEGHSGIKQENWEQGGAVKPSPRKRKAPEPEEEDEEEGETEQISKMIIMAEAADH